MSRNRPGVTPPMVKAPCASTWACPGDGDGGPPAWAIAFSVTRMLVSGAGGGTVVTSNTMWPVIVIAGSRFSVTSTGSPLTDTSAVAHNVVRCDCDGPPRPADGVGALITRTFTVYSPGATFMNENLPFRSNCT